MIFSQNSIRLIERAFLFLQYIIFRLFFTLFAWFLIILLSPNDSEQHAEATAFETPKEVFNPSGATINAVF